MAQRWPVLVGWSQGRLATRLGVRVASPGTVSSHSGEHRLRVEVEQSNGDKQLVLYDGKQITAFSSSQNVYAQASKPGDIDSAVIYFVKDLHMRLPLAGIVPVR